MKEIDATLHKVPPQNIEAEQSVLGGILLDNLALNTVLELLETSDFYSEAHRKIFSSIIDLSNRNEPCDLITLSNILKDQKRIEQVGGTAYLASLVDHQGEKHPAPSHRHSHRDPQQDVRFDYGRRQRPR
jgi:replicative DNA helicase